MREASRVATDVSLPDQITVVAVFPRRPKVLYGGDTEVAVKFNRELFVFAHHVASFGIPVFAAAPVASSLLEMMQGQPSAWFEIIPNENPGELLQLVRDERGNLPTATSDAAVRGPLSVRGVLQAIHARAHRQTWPTVLATLANARKQTYGFGYPMFRGYRPYVVFAW